MFDYRTVLFKKCTVYVILFTTRGPFSRQTYGMPEREDFLNLTTKPVLLTYQQVAWMTGLTDNGVAVAVSKKLLKVAGNPVSNARKFIPLQEVEKLRNDGSALNKIVTAIYQHRKKRNKSGVPGSGEAAIANAEE